MRCEDEDKTREPTPGLKRLPFYGIERKDAISSMSPCAPPPFAAASKLELKRLFTSCFPTTSTHLFSHRI